MTNIVQTATGEEKSPEQATHLAARTLMVGYGTVVGAMRLIRDTCIYCGRREFYKKLSHDGQTRDEQADYTLGEQVGKGDSLS